MNKKVVVVVRGGVATAFAEQGVDVVIVDHDDLPEYRAKPDECLPVHSSFLPLMEFAEKRGWDIWPNVDDGRINDADVVPGLSSSHVVSFKKIGEEMPAIGKPLLCKMADRVGKKQMILTLTPDRVMDSGGLLNRQFFLLDDVKQWAYLPDECDLHEELLQFTGSEKWYEHPLQPSMTYTDGVKYFVDKTNGSWLLNIVATEYPALKEQFLVSIKAIQRKDSCSIVFADPDGHEIFSRQVEHATEIPEGVWTFYLTNNVLLLPSEY